LITLRQSWRTDPHVPERRLGALEIAPVPVVVAVILAYDSSAEASFICIPGRAAAIRS
jgi:hypothetical protein